MEFFMMKKTAIALGIAAMAFGAQAADLINTADNKLELNVDVAAYYQSRTTATTGVITSQLLGKGMNQIQLRNTKTLPNGWKIIGQAELDYDPVGDNAPALSDDMRVALDIPVWGRISAGQFDTFYEDNVAESLGFWGIGDLAAYAAEPASTSDGKRLQYYNKYGDLQVVLDTTFGYATSALTSQEIGLVGTVAYKLGDLQLFVGGGYVPSYYSDAGTATQNTFKTVNNSSVVSMKKTVVFLMVLSFTKG
jgi:predicted porin